MDILIDIAHFQLRRVVYQQYYWDERGDFLWITLVGRHDEFHYELVEMLTQTQRAELRHVLERHLEKT